MKKIDRLLITGFIGPFLVSFGIALFVLVMQFLWLYIDEIAGKGVSVLILFELVGYLSVSTFPLALPIAVLISSVMLFGNLAERYELSSMKSAGVSLLRIMWGPIMFAMSIALFSYACSAFIIPWTNLQFKSRLYDIRKQKPALTLEKDVFNEDFRAFAIRIGDKARDGETIGDVMIEDQTNSTQSEFNKILADSGQMFTTADKRFFVMNLFNGAQYQKPTHNGSTKQKYPFVRTTFKSWTKVWDLKEFDMVSTDQDRFKGQRTMLSINQLQAAMDSLIQEMKDAQQGVPNDLMRQLRKIPVKPEVQPAPPTPVVKIKKSNSKKSKRKKRLEAAVAALPAPGLSSGPILPKQQLDKPLTEYGSFAETFQPEGRAQLMRETDSRIKSSITTFETTKIHVMGRRREAVKTGYELYIKYCYAIICFIFIFIGAPMGAIIRKGGFGYPILIAIIFFVIFIVLTIMCRKLSDSYILTPFWAAMTPCLIMLPVGTFLTIKAMNDTQMVNTDRIERWIKRLAERFNRVKVAEAIDG